MRDAAARSDRPLTQIHVLIVEDHRMVAEAIGARLTEFADIRVDGYATSGAEARELVASGNHDVCLLDLQLPDCDGLVLAAELLQAHSEMGVVIMTAHVDRQTVSEAMRLGCCGFVAKSEALAHVPDAIRCAANGSRVLSPGVAAVLTSPDAPVAQRSGAVVSLTGREMDVLRLLARGLTTAQLADELFITTTTVRNFLSRINEKLGVHSRVEAIATAARLGLVTMSIDAGP